MFPYFNIFLLVRVNSKRTYEVLGTHLFLFSSTLAGKNGNVLNVLLF